MGEEDELFGISLHFFGRYYQGEVVKEKELEF